MLLGCKKEDILGLIYYYYIIGNNEEDINNFQEKIKTKIFKKIAKLLPQDIIISVPEDNLIKNVYNKVKK